VSRTAMISLEFKLKLELESVDAEASAVVCSVA